MSVFSWAMAAVGLFLVLYAAVFLFRPIGGKQAARRDSLGCGFVVLAGIVWSITLSDYLADRAAGIRLGVALALVLPSLAVLFRHGRRGIAAPLALLVIAVMLGASAVPKLIARLNPSGSAATARDLERAEMELVSRILAADSYRAQLVADRKRTADSVRELGHASFDAISRDEQGLALLEELADIDRMMAETDKRLEQYRADLSRIRTAVRRIKRLALAESTTGEPVSKAEMERILREAADTSEPDAAKTVERHLEREQLRQLFENDLDGSKAGS